MTIAVRLPKGSIDAPTQASIARKIAASGKPAVAVALTDNAAPQTVEEAYLKLHMLSHRLVKPHGTSLDGLFALLPNVAWTNMGPVCLSELADRQLDARLKGVVLEVSSVDKFPKMTPHFCKTSFWLKYPACAKASFAT